MVHLVYMFLSNLLIIATILLVYQKMTQQALKIPTHLVTNFIFVIYMFLSRNIIADPVRIVLAFLLVYASLKIMHKQVSWLGLMMSFATIYIVWMITALLAIAVIGILGIHNELIFLKIGLAFPALAYVWLYKKNKLSEYLMFFNEQSVKISVYSVVFLILMLHSIFNVAGYILMTLSIEDTLILLNVWSVMLLSVVAIISLAIYSVSYLVKSNKERLLLDKSGIELKVELDKLISKHHKYRHVVPSLLMSYQGLICEITNIIGAHQSIQLQRVENYISLVKSLSNEISDEFFVDDVRIEVDYLAFLDEWLDLAGFVEHLIRIARDEGVYLAINNHATTWSDLTITKMDFIRLFGNIVDNAIKETKKLVASECKQVIIIFKDIDGCFSFEVIDTAAEFDLEILMKLGMRKNSTNGTGDGYFEILEILTRSKASLTVHESKNGSDFSKKIRVVFDNLSIFAINSNYRKAQLDAVLKYSNIKSF